MATGSARGTDVDVGIGLVLGLLTVAAGVYTFVAPGQLATAVGFAVTVTFAVLTVSAIHVWA